jgi:aspartyl aminopeptidase
MRNSDDLRAFLDASPTPDHAVHTAASMLVAAGFHWFASGSALPTVTRPTKGVITRDGALVAFVWNPNTISDGIRLVGAHTDSPGLHMKTRHVRRHGTLSTLGVEVYGSPLLNSWLDRDLELAGVAILDDGSRRTWRSGSPVARIAQLAVHLDRQVNDTGVVLDKHSHLRPLWAGSEVVVADVARWAGVAAGRIVEWDARFIDHQPAEVIGSDAALLASGRLDNLLSCWAATRALEASSGGSCAVIALFDHEEVGSQSPTGAAGPLLSDILELLTVASGVGRDGFLRAMANSVMVSADNSHGIHPNYPERHDPETAPQLHAGVALKRNASQRYATTARSAAAFVEACAAAGVQHQVFASRNSIPCGSTIGPIAATRLGIDVVDVGVPQLSMHSAREVCSVRDADDLRRVLTSFLSGKTKRVQSAKRASRRA